MVRQLFISLKTANFNVYEDAELEALLEEASCIRNDSIGNFASFKFTGND